MEATPAPASESNAETGPIGPPPPPPPAPKLGRAEEELLGARCTEGDGAEAEELDGADGGVDACEWVL